jgi:hypothetical protein
MLTIDLGRGQSGWYLAKHFDEVGCAHSRRVRQLEELWFCNKKHRPLANPASIRRVPKTDGTTGCRLLRYSDPYGCRRHSIRLFIGFRTVARNQAIARQLKAAAGIPCGCIDMRGKAMNHSEDRDQSPARVRLAVVSSLDCEERNSVSFLKSWRKVSRSTGCGYGGEWRLQIRFSST